MATPNSHLNSQNERK